MSSDNQFMMNLERNGNCNWSPEVTQALKLVMNQMPGRDVVSDLDYSILHGDIGDTVFSRLALTDRLSPATIPFGKRSGELVSSIEMVAAYRDMLKEALQLPLDNRGATLSKIYGWLVQILNGLTVEEVVHETLEAFKEGSPLEGIEPPIVRPLVLRLLGEAQKRGARVFVISASNQWSILTTVKHLINPSLVEQGFPPISEDRVFGIRTTIDEDKGNLITSSLCLPITSFGGKADLLATHNIRPLLSIGDSSNDFQMADCSQNALFLARSGAPETKNEILKFAETRPSVLIENLY